MKKLERLGLWIMVLFVFPKIIYWSVLMGGNMEIQQVDFQANHPWLIMFTPLIVISLVIVLCFRRIKAFVRYWLEPISTETEEE